MQDMEPACLAIYRGMQRGKGVWAHESQRGSATIESSALPYFSRSAGPIPEPSRRPWALRKDPGQADAHAVE
jgi:hypothetical protein